MEKYKNSTVKIINIFAIIFFILYYLTIFFDFSGSLIIASNCDDIYHRIVWVIVFLSILNIIFFIMNNKRKTLYLSSDYLQNLMLNKEYMLLIVLFIWSIVSVFGNYIVTGDGLWSKNYEPMYELLFSIFFFFPLGFFCSIEKIKKIAIYIIHSFMIFMIIIGTYIFYKMIHLEIITTYFGGKIGMDKSYRLMINSNPNITGLYMLAFVMISLFFVLVYKNIFRYIYIYGTFIFFMLLALSGCRSGFVGFLVGLCFFIGIIPFRLNLNVESILKKIVISILGTLLGFTIVYFLRKLPFYLIKVINEIDDKSRDLNITYSSGRLKIWLCALKGSVKSFKNILLGTTPGGVIDFIGVMTKGTFYGYTHNQFIEILVATGFIGLIIYIIWIIYIAKKCFNICFNTKNISLYQLYIPCIILSCVVANMFEAVLLYQQFLIGNLFIFLCGYISGFKKTNLKN